MTPEQELEAGAEETAEPVEEDDFSNSTIEDYGL